MLEGRFQELSKTKRPRNTDTDGETLIIQRNYQSEKKQKLEEIEVR